MGQRRLVRRVAELVVAILLAATAAVVHHAFVFARFEPIRLDVVSETLHASRRTIRIPLPDLSTLRGQTAVVGLRLQNTLLEQRRIGLTRDGFPTDRVVLPPHRTIHWDIVLSPDLVRELDREVGDAARALELTGDADGWALSALDIRNYHLRAGDRMKVVVVPAGASAHLADTRLLPVLLALAILVLVSTHTPASQRRWLRLVGHGLTLTALLACLICLFLPALSPYKVLLSRPAFWLIAAGLFAPVLLHAASALIVAISSLLQRSAVRGRTIWKHHDVTCERAAALLGLSAIAIAQPVFEVVSNSPEFFAARGTPAATAAAAVLTICFAVPLGLFGIERAVRVASSRAATIFYGITLAALSALLVMPWIRRLEGVIWPWDAVIGGLVGAAVATVGIRTRSGRQFLAALAPAAVAVPVLFLADPGMRQSLRPSESVASVQTIARTPPIVFVIFDELPLHSLLTAEGHIDAGRYPNFAALAREAHWFRNASTVAANTSHAVPAILSGRYPTAVDDVPTLEYYPVNLFTTLAPRYEIFPFFRFQKLCPPRACHRTAHSEDTVESLLSDLGLVWLHIVLPPTLTDALPPVTEDWAEFGRAGAAPAEGGQQSRADVFAQFVASIDGRPARMHFIHSMLPHMALEYVPSGRRYRGADHEGLIYRRSRLFERATAAYADTLHQRHLAQVAFVDRLLGDLILRLRKVGAYDDALIVITADHGASYRDGRSRREPMEDRNLSDILRVPLLIKLPGQRRGEIVDRIVETVDILPTILDVIGAKTPIRFDGRSLVDDRVPARVSRTFVWRNRRNVSVRPVEDLSAESAESVNRKERRFGRGDVNGLYAPPAARHLLGMSRSAVRPAADVRIRIRNSDHFEAVDLARDPLPLYVTGIVRTSRPAPLSVAVMVNGIVAAVTHSYVERGGHMFGTLIPEPSLRNGHNIVAAVVIDGLAK